MKTLSSDLQEFLSECELHWTHFQALAKKKPALAIDLLSLYAEKFPAREEWASKWIEKIKGKNG